jgi:hypothetical protein
VVVVDELADAVARFLGETPLPAVQRELDDLRAGAGATYGVGIEDVALLRRLVLKRCVYGVDLSRMGAEIAKVSLWLASFVPGLSLSYLDHNVRVGNSLIGVADLDQVRNPWERDGQIDMVGQEARAAAAAGAEAAARLLAGPDRTPDEVAESAAAEGEVRDRVSGARQLLDLWVAEPLGLPGARAELWRKADPIKGAEHALNQEESERLSALAEEAEVLAAHHRVLHWPLEFPEVFADGGRGFDAVIGNPPWEEIMVEELGFYGLYQPGLRALPETARIDALDELLLRRPHLQERYEAAWKDSQALRAFFGGDTGYLKGPGHPDLYKFFCQRYRQLLRRGGRLGVVLPRSAFSAKGSADFRGWVFEEATVERLDFLLNNRRWLFDTHPQYTVALVTASASAPPAAHELEIAGVARSSADFERQSRGPGLQLAASALGPSLEVPLLPTQAAADLLAKLRTNTPFALGGGRWQCFPTQELNETFDRKLWEGQTAGHEVWKGSSFERYDPHGADARVAPMSEALLAKVHKRRPGGGSLVAQVRSVPERATAVRAELEHARVAFRDVARATDSRTVIAALVPPHVFLTNTAPYLAFLGGGDLARAACLGVMNSLAFDWQARRFVETHLNFFVLEGLRVPALDDAAFRAVAHASARLSCVDERFAAFAESVGVEHGPLEPEERERLLVEVDALVGRAWGLTSHDLDVVFADFTFDAVPEAYRERLRGRLDELTLEAEPRRAPPVGQRA